MDERAEFVKLALLDGSNKSELCRRFGVSRTKGDKWLKRFEAEGYGGLADRSRRPHTSPSRTDQATEAEVLRIRAKSNNAWGGRKIARVMRDHGWVKVPSTSTITEILRRHGKLNQNGSEHPGPFQRFERSQPNELWQMDFKGHFPMSQGRCHPLTVLDDHSRYGLGLEACGNEQDMTVRQRLTTIFRRYGMPFEMLMDNGSPWGDCAEQPYTVFGAWLMRLGIAVRHGRPFHPQTQGKDERFHRSFKAEVLNGNSFRDLDACQRAFDHWRHVYNHERPHEALGLATPASRYRLSPRTFPERLPPIEYAPGDIVRKVSDNGHIGFKARTWRIGKPYRGQPIALRPTAQDGIFAVHFCSQRIATLNLRDKTVQACGFVDADQTVPTNQRSAPTTPQAQHQTTELSALNGLKNV